ncbi:hypothetical protein EV174_006939, partial [Coemansia sp. RSA 2320]
QRRWRVQAAGAFVGGVVDNNAGGVAHGQRGAPQACRRHDALQIGAARAPGHGSGARGRRLPPGAGCAGRLAAGGAVHAQLAQPAAAVPRRVGHPPPHAGGRRRSSGGSGGSAAPWPASSPV